MLPQLSRTFRRMNMLSNLLRRDFERNINRTFQTFDMLEHRNAPPRVDENTFYRMKMMLDDNGHVKVKTAQKEPGKEWDIQVREYDRRNNMDAIGHENSKQKVEALEGKKKVDEKVDMKKTEKETTNFKVTNASENVADTKTESKIDNTQTNNEIAKREISHFDEVESIFDSINKDFEANVRRALGFDSFHRFEKPVVKSESKAIEHDKPQKKVETTEEVKSEKNTILSSKETETESKKDNSLIHELATKGATGFDEIQTVFDNINQEFENKFRRTLSMFEPFSFRAWPEPFRYSIEFDPENTFYNMKRVVNDNGHVKVKTARKEPGKEWDVKEEEYDSKDKAIDEGNSNIKKENAAIAEEITKNAQIAN